MKNLKEIKRAIRQSKERNAELLNDLNLKSLKGGGDPPPFGRDFE